MNTLKDDKVFYIVKLKDDFNMPNTIINREFCGYLVEGGETMRFRLNDLTKCYILCPYDSIEWMAPARINSFSD